MFFKWQPLFHIKSNKGLLKIRPVKTLLETFILFIVAVLVGQLTSLFFPDKITSTIPPEASDELALGVLILLIFGIVIAPLFEELIYRLIPQLIINKIALRFISPQKRNLAFWSAGILTSLLFAWTHASGYFFGTQFSRIPVSQFMFGIYFWSLLRERGFLHLVFAHTFVNFLVPASVIVLFIFHSIFEFLK